MMEAELELKRKRKLTWVSRQRPNHTRPWKTCMDDNDLFCSQWI